AARPALALLATYAGASVWAGVVDLRELWMVRDAMAGTPLTQAAIDAAVERQSQTFWAFLIVLVLTAIAFLRWVHVANKSLRHLGEYLEYTRAQTVRSFFIPILNLFRPYTAVANLWRMSGPGEGAARAVAPLPLFFKAWWLTWIGSGIVTRIASRLYTRAEDL